MVGIVTEVGSKVTKFKIGDNAGVAYIVGSCGSCDNCNQDLENYCSNYILTSNGKYHDGTTTYGGLSDKLVVEERFAFRIPDTLPLDGATPLLCAGTAVYSPMKYFGLSTPGTHLGIVGLGGLGHVAVKFAKAFGVKVRVISTSPSKKEEAMEKYGADAFLVSKDPEEMQAAAGTMDGIIDTVTPFHPVLPLLDLLKTNGKLVILWALDRPFEIPALPLVLGRKSVAGSGSAGPKETQEMLDFAGEHKITADVEVIPMDYVNTAMGHIAKSDVKYRFVVDVANTLTPTK